jgi:8-oxo-dGTP pyrophosphatase MutT (NUDIX family)
LIVVHHGHQRGRYFFMEGADMTPIWRPTARLLVVDPDERVLLFGSVDDDEKKWWFTPGGGLQRGETVTEAAVRELAEETGFACTEAELGPVVATSAGLFTGYDGRLYFGAHTFFCLRVTRLEIVSDGQEDYELSFITEHRWWTAGELRSTADDIFPPPLALADLMGRLLRGDVPDPPIRLPRRDQGTRS